MNEMRKLIETIEEINEDPSVGGNIADLQRKLTDVSSYAEELYWNYEKYPALAEYQAVMQDVMTECDRLRRKVYEIR